MSKRPATPGGLKLYAEASPTGVDHTLRPIVAEAVRRFHAVKESAPTVARTAVREASVGGATTTSGGRLLLRLISAGWSLNNNHYGANVLREAAASKAWGAGTRCYVDHMSDEEEQAHPSGSVKNLAAVLTEDARWDESTQSLVAEARLFEPWRGPLSQMAEADAIGMSIRAWVTGEQGERDGREGFIVDWVEGRSVDFVTVPAAGGAIISVLEAVGHLIAEAPNLGAWLESRLHLALTQYADDMYGDGRLTRPERIVLSGAIGDGLQAYTTRIEVDAPQLYQRSRWSMPDDEPAVTSEARSTAEASTDDTRTGLVAALRDIHGTDDNTWVWVRDFDPEQHLVWFEVSAKNDSKLWQQAYTGAGNTVAVDGDPVEVVPRTVYDPVPAAADDAGEAAADTTPDSTVVAVDEDVTEGAPPPVPVPPILEEEPVSGTQTGAPPEQAGIAPVPDNGQPPAATPTAPVLESAPAVSVQPTSEAIAAIVAAAVREATGPLTATIADLSARESQRDAEARTGRNRQTATEAVTTALQTAEHAEVRESIHSRVTSRVAASVPTTTDGGVDMSALGELITSVIADEATHVRRERANALAEAGVGLPYGMGAAPVQESEDDGLDAELTAFFKDSLGMSAEAASVAGKGRR